MDKKCVVCKKVITSKSKYCSSRCSDMAYWSRKIEKKHISSCWGCEECSGGDENLQETNDEKDI